MSTSDSERNIRVGAVQFAPVFKNISANVETIISTIEGSDADLLVFPELSVSGYAFSTSEEAAPFATRLDSAEVERISIACKRSKCSAVIGFIEDGTEGLYNAAFIINAEGKLAGLYRKVHLFYREKHVFTPGDLGFPVFDVMVKNGGFVRVGVEICYDWRFPEATRSLALAGAQVVVVPANIVTTTGMLIDTLRVRAFENKVNIIFADRIGSERFSKFPEEQELTFRGESCIIGYNGEVLEKLASDSKSTCYSTLNLEKTVIKTINGFNDILGDRRPSEYRI